MRPRFSLRTLAIIVALVCAYFGAWEATKRYIASVRPNDFLRQYEHRYKPVGILSQEPTVSLMAPAPLIIQCDTVPLEVGGCTTRHYYIWLLGPVFTLPFESTKFDPPNLPDLVEQLLQRENDSRNMRYEP